MNKAVTNLEKARKIARTLPGADIHDDLDALLRTVYMWTESGGRHVKLYECKMQDQAMSFSKRLKDFMAASEILGSTQLYSEGRIFVDFWDSANSTVGSEIDTIFESMMFEY